MSNVKERSLVLVKPDGVQRNLIGDIISRFEKTGLKITAMKFVVPNKDQAYKHYVKNEAEITALGERSIAGKKKGGQEVNDDPTELGKSIVDRLVRFLSSGPVVAVLLEGNNACAITRKIVGSTEPLQSEMGTIRGDYTLDSYNLADKDNRAVRNLVHASANPEEAEQELVVWFNKEEIFQYNSVRDKILYDVNLDNINE